MPVASRSFSNAYQDSVKLMRVASDVIEHFGVDEALAVMATDENKSMVVDAGLLDEAELAELGPNDLLLAVEDVDTDTASQALDEMEAAIRGQQAAEPDPAEGPAPAPKSVYSAMNRLPDANLALVSVPGEYAAREAWKALHEGLHVHLFSDNVDIEDERALKEFGREADRLVMGPDCGTAIINGVPLGFANAVDRGSIGIVAASGTGLQEVSSLLDRAGAGISQAIGTGGRDLSAPVGGLAMQQGLASLTQNPETEVVVLVSKPPAAESRDTLIQAIEGSPKPVVVCFIGTEADAIAGAGATHAATLADTATAAVQSQPGHSGETVSFADGITGFTDPSEAGDFARRRGDPEPDRGDVRGLFTGGTFSLEAITILQDQLQPVGSNVGVGTPLEDPLEPTGHAIVDLGADEFTRGRPHPMLEPRTRTNHLHETLETDSVLVVLLDVVLGYGAHPDPAASIAEAVRDADPEGWPVVVASVCGTHGDPQGWSDQISQLVDAGVLVAETNADAAKLALGLREAARREGGEPDDR